MTLLQVENLTKRFPVGRIGVFGERQFARAVDGVSLTVGQRETLGLVGESGCGKSTLGRAVLRLLEPNSGSVFYRGQSVTDAAPARMRVLRKSMQMIFQDPYGSLNPRQTIGQIVGEPLVVHRLAGNKRDRAKRVGRLLDLVGIRPQDGSRYPSELSGGQRQRVMIARVLATEPQLVIADEPVSALDVSIQSQVLNLLRDLQAEFGMSYLFISHDVGVVKFMSDRLAVMYLGVIVESGETNSLLSDPLHPYTRSLLASLPSIERRGMDREKLIQGEIPSAINVPSGCRFHPRCPQAMPICRKLPPAPSTSADGHSVACHLYPPREER